MRPHCVTCRRFFYSNPVPAACCFVQNGDGLLLVQRAIEPCRGLWTLPGGFVELGENSEEAVVRELREETGLQGLSRPRLVGATTQPSRLSGAVLLLGYQIVEWSGEPEARSDAQDVGWFRRNARPEIAFQAHRDLIALFDTLLDQGLV